MSFLFFVDNFFVQKKTTRNKKQSCESKVAAHLWPHAMFVIGLLQHEREHIITESAYRTPLNAQYKGSDPGEDLGDASSPPPVIFNNVAEECNFFVISNLFCNNKPYTPKARISRKCSNKIDCAW